MTLTVPDAAVYFRLSRRVLRLLQSVFTQLKQIGENKWKQYKEKNLLT